MSEETHTLHFHLDDNFLPSFGRPRTAAIPNTAHMAQGPASFTPCNEEEGDDNRNEALSPK